MMNNERLSYTVDDALSAIGMGKFQLRLIAYAGVGAVGESMELMLLSYVGLAAQHELKLSVTEQNLISILTYIAMLFGAFGWGIFADFCGRRKAILGLCVLTSITGLVSAFSQSPIQLLFLRALTGIGIGGAQVYTTWYMEFVPRAHRGTSMIWFFAFGAIGTFLEALLAWILMEVVVPEHSWRWLIGGTSLPSIVALLFCYTVPESPRFLCSQGRFEEAIQILQMGAGINQKVLPPGDLLTAQRNKSAQVDVQPERNLDNQEVRENQAEAVADRPTEGAPSTEEVMRNQTEVTEPVVSAQIDESAEAVRLTEGAPSTEVMRNEIENSEINEVDDKDDATVTHDEHYEDSDSNTKSEPDTDHAHLIDIEERSTLQDPLLGKTNGDSAVLGLKVGKEHSTESQVGNSGASGSGKQSILAPVDQEIVEILVKEIHSIVDSGPANRIENEDQSTLNTPLLVKNTENGTERSYPAILMLWSRGWRRTTSLIWLLYFTNTFSYSSLVSLLSPSFVVLSIWRHEVHKNPSFYFDALIVSVAELPGLGLAYWTLDQIGRRYTMLIMSGGGLILSLLQIYGWNTIVATSLVFCTRMFMSATFVALEIYVEEVYPTNLRATGVGVATILGWIGGMVWPALGDLLETSHHPILLMILYAFKILISGVSALLLPIETLGRELEDNAD